MRDNQSAGASILQGKIHSNNEQALLDRGVRLFNCGRYFECHEVLEEAWTHERGPRRIFLQSLIHLAVGLHHIQRGNPAGAIRQFQKGLRKLAGYLPLCEGIDTWRLHKDAVVVLESMQRGEEVIKYPRIHII